MADYLTINEYTADGVQTVWEINFTGGYISKEHVVVNVYDTSGELIATPAFTWLGDFTLSITPASAAGNTVRIQRLTPLDLPLVDFSDGSIVNERTLDENAQQAIFVSAELNDRLAGIEARTFLAPIGESGFTLPGVAGRKDRLLVFDSAGSLGLMSGTNVVVTLDANSKPVGQPVFDVMSAIGTDIIDDGTWGGSVASDDGVWG